VQYKPLSKTFWLQAAPCSCCSVSDAWYLLYLFSDPLSQYISAQRTFWEQKECAVDQILSDCDEDPSKDDKLCSFAAEIHIELMTLVCSLSLEVNVQGTTYQPQLYQMITHSAP